MTDFLNLDDLAPAGKRFNFRGKEYQVGAMSVGAFIRLNSDLKKQRDRIQKGEEFSLEEQLAIYADALLDVVPEISREEIEKMSLRQMQALVQFAQSQGESAAENSAEGKA